MPPKKKADDAAYRQLRKDISAGNGKSHGPVETLQTSAGRFVPRLHTALEPSSGCRTESCYPRAVSAFSREYAAAPCFCKKADASALQSSLRTS